MSGLTGIQFLIIMTVLSVNTLAIVWLINYVRKKNGDI